MKNQEITKSNLQTVKDVISRVSEMSKEDFLKLAESMANFHNYSTVNQIILAQNFCSQVASFKKWKELGRSVKKGGCATWIFAPAIKTVKEENDQTGELEEKRFLKGFVSVPVFDISQTEGEEVKRNMTTSSAVEFKKVLEIAVKLGYEVKGQALEIATGGYISGKTIVLNSNLNDTEKTGTLIHELCHGELGHTEENDNKGRSLKEQEAELTTYIVCKNVGIERKSEFYLKSWRLSENILQSFKVVNKVANKLIDELK